MFLKLQCLSWQTFKSILMFTIKVRAYPSEAQYDRLLVLSVNIRSGANVIKLFTAVIYDFS